LTDNIDLVNRVNFQNINFEKTYGTDLKIDTTATEESLVEVDTEKQLLPGRQTSHSAGKCEILRRPVIVYQLIKCGVGLLRI
jgi:hypothetical protein